jgi:DNA-binding transcriptional ArsR family regulator
LGTVGPVIVGRLLRPSEGEVQMTEHRGSPPEDREVERAIVVRLLPRHYERRSSLQAALKHIEPSELEAALARLREHGVVDALTADSIRVSACAQHLDDLGLVGI